MPCLLVLLSLALSHSEHANSSLADVLQVSLAQPGERHGPLVVVQIILLPETQTGQGRGSVLWVFILLRPQPESRKWRRSLVVVVVCILSLEVLAEPKAGQRRCSGGVVLGVFVVRDAVQRSRKSANPRDAPWSLSVVKQSLHQVFVFVAKARHGRNLAPQTRDLRVDLALLGE